MARLTYHHHRRTVPFELAFALLCLPWIFAHYNCTRKDDGWYYDPERCQNYWRCIHGQAEEFRCAEGTLWDHQENRCNWKETVNCIRVQNLINTTTLTTIPTTTTMDPMKKRKKKPIHEKRMSDTNQSSSTTTVMETESSKASVIPSTHGKDSSGTATIAIECQLTGIYTVADPNECHTYYQCDRGVRSKLTCPEKHLYDTEKNQCMEYERVFCGTRTVNLAEKNQCVNKRDGIHPDMERDCQFYYQCVAQNKMREAKCPADQKFSSYTGKCGPSSSAPAPCGTYVPGRATMSNQSVVGLAVSLLISMSLLIGFQL